MTINIGEIGEKDRNSVLHPFTQLKDFATGKLGDPTIVETGKGIRIQDANGNQLIDGFAGLYCVNVGYGRTEVAEAISRQAYRLAYYHSYAAHTTDELAILSDRLVKMAPNKMSKIFYGMSGSDANETQAKLVWYYNNLRGKPNKKKIISRERGYHGCSVISGSMTGMSFYHDHMDLPLPRILHTGVPHFYWGAQPGETEQEFSKRRAAELDDLIQREGPDTVGAFIGEPVLGTGGITPPPAGYWEAIQPVLRKHDVLLIADEVITGFGRTGSMFGSQHYGIEPDLITIAKGLTSAYFPLSAAMVGEKVYEVLEAGADRVGAFSHGYTYSGHPVGCAAGLAALAETKRLAVNENAAVRGVELGKVLEALKAKHQLVGDVRYQGLMAALELVSDRAAKKPGDKKTLAVVAEAAYQAGVMLRVSGNTIILSPPLVISAADVAKIGEALDAGLAAAA
ncbi:MAG: aminotransferase class III-fold pyridoxal phosphate-dependent enzyme [Mesorhizobium sp.]|nr:MAG: aminotransferase class III-fold pyridoxal phosphate-dependent enzyme [Mesorhizobium sp.]